MGRDLFQRICRAERRLSAVSLDDRNERPLTDFTGRRGDLGTYPLTTDGEYLYFTWEETLGESGSWMSYGTE